MFARVNEFRITADQLDKALADTERVSRELARTPGSVGMYYMVDRDRGKALAITLWDSEESMRRSQGRAGEIRDETTRAEGSSVLGVSEYEVVAYTVNGARERAA